MIRTQIQLTEAQADGLRRLAIETGRSMADLIRQSVEDLLETRRRRPTREERINSAMAAAGRFRSGQTDISERHDDYLIEAFSE